MHSRTIVVRAALLFCFLTTGGTEAAAQGDAQALAQASLEDLMEMHVISAARKEQRAEDVAAAVFVITREQIRRSGLTTLPEILRLAPGVQVAQVNASKWAVSIRGFNDIFSNKLLVLIDGRSIYTRTFGGVIWEAQDLLVDDIERIEVIRGPGGAVWGANAVNGVINVITRPASDTKGLAVEVGGGTLEREHVGVRYGGAAGQAAYRLFSQWSGYSSMQNATEGSAGDHWNSLTLGGRIDWSRAADTLLVQGHYTDANSRPNYLELSGPYPGATLTKVGLTHSNESSVLGRWTRTRATGSVLQAQASTTFTSRDDVTLKFTERSTEADLQYETVIGSHSVVVGSGYRGIDLSTSTSFTLFIGSEAAHIFSAFAQDEITLHRSLTLTLGTKVERDTHAGIGVLPSIRTLWRPAANQRAWAALSRARRTPSSSDRTLRVNFAAVEHLGRLVVIAFHGNPEYRTEEMTAAEAGYRINFGSTASIEVAAFRSSYDHLPTGEPLAPWFSMDPVPHVTVAWQFANLLDARTTGVEVNGTWSPISTWRLMASYSALRLSARVDPGSILADRVDLVDGNAPSHQWQVRSMWLPTARLGADLALYRVGRLPFLDVPAHTRLDARLEMKLSPALSVAVTGRNLLKPQHQEFSGIYSMVADSRIPRSAQASLRWRF